MTGSPAHTGAGGARPAPEPAVLERLRTARSYLFVPGDRPERFERALGSGADAVVVDLEDAVASSAKDTAAGHAATLVQRPSRIPVVVRINEPGSARGRADVAILAATGVPVTVMVPKAEDVWIVSGVLTALTPGSRVVPLIETAAGVLDAPALATAPGVVRLAFGHLDLCAQLGLPPDDRARLAPARLALVLASAAARLPGPIDGVSTEVRELERVSADTRAGLADGFTAKLCIHPGQVPAVHGALAPTAEELAWARTVLAATTEDQVAAVDGRMVDRPVYLRARSVAARADRAPTA